MDTVHLLIAVLLAARSAAAFQNYADVACGYQWGRVSGRVSRARAATRIVGGSTALRGEFPWLVSITRGGGHFCGGSLVSKRWVLTAAHCLCSGSSEPLRPEQVRVSVGQHDLREREASTVGVARLLMHPGYECSHFVHDVALMKLSEDVQWGDTAWPACLPSATGTKDHSSFSDREATAAGWGWTNENSNKGGRADVLQKVQLRVLDNGQCRDWYKSQGKKTKIRDTQICAGFESGGRDSCWADSGGPLMVSDATDGGRVTVVGVVSTGIGCARPKLPGLYTRLSDYVPWIEDQIRDSAH
ncbi:trypsin-1-like [Thrips palmi]|uniref:Trypsin-1-like n=1 Tax=Thrips palmi TaxID=161013 RepID=A0A6P8ZPK4_THRPL|nr:trypsin-1-like [Thrips palmi]